MSNSLERLRPVLLGADMNCYSMARTFHEAYGVRSVAYGRYAMGETKYTRIIDFSSVLDIDTDPVMLEVMQRYAKQNLSETKILLGCTDDYAAMLIRCRDELSKDFIVPYIDDTLAQKLVSKESFYKYCDEFNIPYPATVILTAKDAKTPGRAEKIIAKQPFSYPIIIKPSSSIDYWKHPFEGMKKVYFAQDAEDALQITRDIYASGYPDSLIVQDTIPGDDSNMRVLTAYCDKNAKVKMVCLGHVLLEEHTPKAIGNHAAILTEYNEPLMTRIAHFLESIGYTGFANFDIKFDSRDGQYKVFEINLRQGRSNYYVTGAGLNLARFLVEDRVLGKDLGEPIFFKEERYWHSVPNEIIWEYTGDKEAVAKAKALVAKGEETTALDYDFDTRWNPLRKLYLHEHYKRYFKKYETYCPKPER